MRLPAGTVASAYRLVSMPARLGDPLLRRLQPVLAPPRPPLVCRAKGFPFRYELTDFDETSQRKLFYYGRHDLLVTGALRSLLRPGDTYVDAGANFGWHTLVAASLVGSGGRVVAFEPSSLNAPLLRRNVELNGFGHVTVEAVAVSDHDGSASLHGTRQRTEDGTMSTARGTLRGDAGDDETAETVQLVRLDTYLAGRGIDRVRLIKIDVEGHEMQTLRGLGGLLEAGAVEHLVVEVRDSFLREAGSSADEVVGYLTERGYQMLDLTRSGPVPHAAGAPRRGPDVLFSR